MVIQFVIQISNADTLEWFRPATEHCYKAGKSVPARFAFARGARGQRINAGAK
jgi:hypothetical protein